MEKNAIKKILKILSLILSVSLVMYVAYNFIFPGLSTLKKDIPKKTSFMKYREKQRTRQGNKEKISFTWAPLSKISFYLINAVLIAEDDKFWQHKGFDFQAIQDAIEKDIKRKELRYGGSTITQQLAKNLYLTPSKNPIRKIKEAILTWRIERSIPKKRILELYLNVVEWGNGIFGAEAASLHYYGKAASELSPQEATRLAAVLPNPIKLNPIGDSNYIEKRSNEILQIMTKRGMVITKDEEITW